MFNFFGWIDDYADRMGHGDYRPKGNRKTFKRNRRKELKISARRKAKR